MRARRPRSSAGAASRAARKRASAQLPFAAAMVHTAQLVLDRCERRRLALGGRALVARQSAAVVAEQGAHVADALVQSAGVRAAQGQRRLEMLERVGVSVQRRGMLRGELVALRCARVIAGQPQVRSDEGRALLAWPPPRQRGRCAPVEQAAPCEAGLLVDQRAELLVREVVDGLRSRGFPHDALRDQLLERTHGFLFASSARLPHRVAGRTTGRSAAAAPST